MERFGGNEILLETADRQIWVYDQQIGREDKQDQIESQRACKQQQQEQCKGINQRDTIEIKENDQHFHS